MRSNKPIYAATIACILLLILGGNLSGFGIFAEVPSKEPLSPQDSKWPFFDTTTLLTDIGSFIIIGILSYIATRINAWINSNREFKQKLIDQQRDHDELVKVVNLAIADLKSYKEINSKEIDEIANDYQGINTRVIQGTERINIMWDDMKELHKEIRNK